MPAAMPEPPLWLVLGASSSVARAFVRLAAAGGAALILAGRDLADMERSAADARLRGAARVEVRRFDAIDGASHAAFVAALPRPPSQRAPGLRPAASAGGDRPRARSGAAGHRGQLPGGRLHPRPTRAALAAAGQGAIVVLSSVAGDRGRPSNFVYGSAKAGLNVYLQGLRARLSHRGVSVTTIKAGFMDTAMTYGLPGMFLVASPEAARQSLSRCCREEAQRRCIFRFLVVDHGDHQGDSRSVSSNA